MDLGKIEQNFDGLRILGGSMYEITVKTDMFLLGLGDIARHAFSSTPTLTVTSATLVL